MEVVFRHSDGVDCEHTQKLNDITGHDVTTHVVQCRPLITCICRTVLRNATTAMQSSGIASEPQQ